MTQRIRSSIDAYRGNHHTFWPRLYSVHGRYLSGLSDSTVAKAMEYRLSDIGVGSDGRTVDAGVGTPSSPPVLIPASVFEVLDRIAEERS